MLFARTPKFISTKVEKLCRQINPDVQPTYINITPGSGCEVNDCFECVRQKVARDGGRIQFGWSIWEWPNVYVEAEHHAVYESPTGPPWLDITPSALSEVRRRLFLPDDTATYDFQNEGTLRDNKRMALNDDPLIQDFLAVAEEKAAILNSIPGVGAIYVDEETDNKLKAAERKREGLLLMLAMKYTPRNERCFCGSGQKFKYCHGRGL